MQSARDYARQVIQAYLDETGWSPTRLAREAGVVPSTINRFLNNPHHKAVVGTSTLMKLEDAVARWRAEQVSAPAPTCATGPIERGRFVHDPEQLAWLRIWDAMSREDRVRAVLMLNALASSAAKFA